jgi:hypothetical protein
VVDQLEARRIVRAVVIVSVGIFCAELLVKLLMERYRWDLGALDFLLGAGLVTSVTFPLLYFFLGRPAEKSRARLEREIRERTAAENELAEHGSQLEELVRERTSELET